MMPFNLNAHAQLTIKRQLENNRENNNNNNRKNLGSKAIFEELIVEKI